MQQANVYKTSVGNNIRGKDAFESPQKCLWATQCKHFVSKTMAYEHVSPANTKF